MQLKGVLEDIVFRNEDNGYTVINISSDNKLITCAGIFPPVMEGENLILDGDFITTVKFGEQFKVKNVRFSKPDNCDGIIKYLSSGLFKGIGVVTATNIINKYKEQSIDVIEKYPLELASIKGITKKHALEISDQHKSYSIMKETMFFLQNYEISVNMCLKIYKAYGTNSIKTVTENPYSLIDDIDGIGFQTADRLAIKIGISSESRFRVTAGIEYILKDTISSFGHTYLPKQELIESVSRLLNLNENDLIAEGLLELEVLGKIISIDSEKLFEEDNAYYGKLIMSTFNYNNTISIATKLANLISKSKQIHLDIDARLKEYELSNSIALHENQKEAIKGCFDNGVMVITGGPGTGKTTIIQAIIHILKQEGLNVQLCAPTGRASKRMSETTGEDAKTIHRLLDLDFKNGKGYFSYNENTQLDCDAIIIDEISMCDEYIFNSLIKAIRNGCRLIMVGDKDQLPSVGAGNVLADIINSKRVAIYNLTKIYRQAETGLITINAHKINNGEMPTIDNGNSDFFFSDCASAEAVLQNTVTMTSDRIPKFKNINPYDIQILCPMKKGVSGTINTNIELQRALNPASADKKELIVGKNLFRERDKVIHTVNNYKLEWTRDEENGVGVFNGDIGIITEISSSDRFIKVKFEDDREAKYTYEDCEALMLAYAISIHKSQGSEFKVVIIALSGGSHLIMTRNLLYTALTRAKLMAVILGSKENVFRMVKNNFTAKRYTLLEQFLIKELDYLHANI